MNKLVRSNRQSDFHELQVLNSEFVVVVKFAVFKEKRDQNETRFSKKYFILFFILQKLKKSKLAHFFKS